MSGRADPGAKERGARRRENRDVGRFYSRQRDFGERDDTRALRIRRGDGTAVAHIGIGELEPRLLVVLLLRHHTIEPDHACTSVRNSGVPYAQSVAAAAQIFPYDVEPEEGEARAVIDAGDGGGRSAVELADEKAARIDRGEAGGVGEARVPAFGRRPVDGD